MKAKSMLLFTCSFLFQMAVCIGQDGRIIESEVYKPTIYEKARKFYNDGTAKLTKGEYSGAISLFKSAIIEDSNYVDAFDNLGLCFRRMNMLDSAEKYYLLSQKKYPAGTVAIQNLAVVESLRENYQKAIEYYTKFTQLKPEDPEGYYGLSRMYLILENYSSALVNGLLAEKYYKQKNSPYIGDCYYVLCWIYYSSNNVPLAKKYLGLAKANGIAVDPNLERELK